MRGIVDNQTGIISFSLFRKFRAPNLFFIAGEYLKGREAPVRGEGCGFKSHLPSQTQTLFGSLMKFTSGRRVFASAVKAKG
jgi:hypothetical protein